MLIHNLSLLGIRPNGYVLIDRYKLPLVSCPYDLAEWSREITETEYLDLVGPPDIEALRAKHPGLRRMIFCVALGSSTVVHASGQLPLPPVDEEYGSHSAVRRCSRRLSQGKSGTDQVKEHRA
ncbi:hypothetical protein ACI0FS_23060 [Ochrobactrum quorumnocens]|uniref:hypothetical protein n=1 Tax=Ochrobactrum quorumnocens TaxID=271865 RepID=UPI0012FD7A2E|nr:hypothetical protein [[Ochrobactrum] quorumnocens]